MFSIFAISSNIVGPKSQKFPRTNEIMHDIFIQTFFWPQWTISWGGDFQDDFFYFLDRIAKALNFERPYLGNLFTEF